MNGTSQGTKTLFPAISFSRHPPDERYLNLRAPHSITGWPKLNGDDLPPLGAQEGAAHAVAIGKTRLPSDDFDQIVDPKPHAERA
jgi:hypothetical protein